MITAVKFLCSPSSMFHFGRYAYDTDTALGDTSSIMHSDTLFAALINTHEELFDNTDDFVTQFEKGNVLISSLFFCIDQGNSSIWFLPKPVSFDLNEVRDYKKFKKIKFISKGLWEDLQDKKSIEALYDSGRIKIIQNEFALLTSELNLSEYEWEKLKMYNSPVLPKVHVRKPTKEGSLFQLNTIEVADNTFQNLKAELVPKVHYYFLVKTTDDFQSSFGENLKKTLEVLSYNGIGSDRTTIGKLQGLQIIEDWNIKTEGSFYCTLSLFSPKKDEIEDLVYYNTILRGGRRIGSDSGYVLQKSAKLLSEGAILKQNSHGCLKDVTPQGIDRIYKRNGIAFNIPIPEIWIPQ